MCRPHHALLALALLGCGSSGGETPPTGASPATPPTAPVVTPVVAPEAPPATATGTAPAPAAPGDVGHLGWAERERRTFVLQTAARGDVTGIGIARGGTHVAVGSSSGFVTMLDAATGEVRASERIARTSEASFELQVIGDVALVRWWGYTGSGVEIWRWRQGSRLDVAEVAELELSDARAALSPRGDRFVLGTAEAIHVASTRNGHLATTVEGSHLGRLAWPHAGAIIEEVDHGAGGRTLVRVLDPRTLAELWTAEADALAIGLPAGDRIALLDGADVVVRALPGGEERARAPHGLAGADRIEISREGDRVAVSSETTSAVIALAGGARTEIPGGRALWVSPRNVLLEAEDGSVRRWVLERARLGARVVPPRAVADEELGEPEPSNLVVIDPGGTVASARGDRVEVVQPSGTRHEFAHGGEHSVWSVSVDPGHTGLAIGGRFGVQAWRADGPHESTCEGATSSMVVAWPEGLVVSDGECDVASGARSRTASRDPFVVSDDGRHVVGSDGSFVDRASGRRAQLEGQTELFCIEGDDCSGTGTISAGGTAVVLELYYAEEDGYFVHETASGRRIATLPFHSAYTSAPDGAWLAYAGASTLRWLDVTGEAHVERTLAGDRREDEELTGETGVVLAASPDGRSIAWTPGNGHRVHVISVGDGTETARIPVGAKVLELRWAASGSQLAIRTARDLRIQDVGAEAPARTLASARGTLAITCSERVLRWIRDAPAGGLEVVALGACGAAEALPRLARGSQLVWIDEGIVRARRLEGGAELTLRTIRDGDRLHRLAHDAEGHWWTDEAATEAAPVPTWVRHGDGRGGETTPLDPAMRRDDLLQRFFAPAAG